MKLESEFRIRLQLHLLEDAPDCFPVAPQSDLTPSTWVRLLQPPSEYGYEEAMLLCQCAENQWIAWVPDYGEVVLETDEFCRLS